MCLTFTYAQDIGIHAACYEYNSVITLFFVILSHDLYSKYIRAGNTLQKLRQGTIYETDDLAHIHQLRHLWAYSIVAAPDACADPAALAAKWAPAWAELRCSVDSAATTAGSDAALAAQWVQRIGGGVQWSFLAAIATALCATAWWAIWP